jgi:hypothetical protein
MSETMFHVHTKLQTQLRLFVFKFLGFSTVGKKM